MGSSKFSILLFALSFFKLFFPNVILLHNSAFARIVTRKVKILHKNKNLVPRLKLLSMVQLLVTRQSSCALISYACSQFPSRK
jgi:hypothetical protein